MKIDFKCTACGQCCRQGGYVFIDAGEARSIAELLGITKEEFLRLYSERFQGSLRLKGDYNKPCIFLENTSCTVYDKRPSQCRTFPFWGENFKYSGRLREIKSFCRGIKTDREVI